MWIARKYEPIVQKLFSQFPAVVLTGARQVGKTSLVRHLFPDAEYVTLDLPAIAAEAENSPESFFSSRREPLIIDEVQYAPSLFRYLKTLIDADKKPGRFLLTGSQNFLLMQGVSESLAGRCGILNMLNLSAAEISDAFGNFDERRCIVQGGYPELYNTGINPGFWYGSYLSTYLERDVRNILNIGSLRDFDRFLRAVASRTGQLLSYSDLAHDIGIAPNTAKKWISALQASGQIYLLEPYYKNIGKRLIKSPKLYLCDTGMAAFLMGFETWDELARNPAAGAIWETHVVMQIVKHLSAQGRMLPLWFWRTSQGDEVDVLIEQGGRFTAIECKFSENVDASACKGIQSLAKEYGADCLLKGYIASRTSNPYPLTEKISAVNGNFIHSCI